MEKQYCLGIDLGTTNSAMAVTREDRIEVVAVTQLVAAGRISEKETLASALFVPPEAERGRAFELPWESGEPPDYAVGHLARDRGATLPDRLVVSAKSWLCNHHVDRQEPVLPWQSEIKEKRSPFEASRLFLEHLKNAFIFHGENRDASFSLDACDVVLTVPASFDEVARSLTHEAAEQAGLGRVVLLEEPLAAFYAWIDQAGAAWRDFVEPGDVVLVVDVGGGTADFTLVAISETDGDLQLDRLSVGEHILLGGDNMDLALAYTVRGEQEAVGKKMDNWQFLSLTHAVRTAKEKLWSDESLTEVPLAVPGRGAGLLASTISTKLTREVLEQVILEGFIPMTTIDDFPRARESVGLREYGLSFAADPVLGRHLARFLVRSLENVSSNETLSGLVDNLAAGKAVGFLKPTKVLFNGGVFHAPALRKRVLDLLTSWCRREVLELHGAARDLAVARGAAVYGRIRQKGERLRIRSGTTRSYYLGLETAMPAVPGFEPPVKGLCIVPQGLEEGSEICVEEQQFGLVTGDSVKFRFFSSSVRAGDRTGMVIEDAARELDDASSLALTLPSSGGTRDVVPVKLHAVVTEVGTLELWMQQVNADQKWKLEFNVRGEER